MKFAGWIKGQLFHRNKAMFRYKRGMARAKLHELEAALTDYTAVIEMPEASAEIRAMALYNRSIVYTANHNDSQAIGDLEALLEMAGAAANVKLEARRKLVRMQRMTERAEERSSPREF